MFLLSCCTANLLGVPWFERRGVSPTRLVSSHGSSSSAHVLISWVTFVILHLWMFAPFPESQSRDWKTAIRGKGHTFPTAPSGKTGESTPSQERRGLLAWNLTTITTWISAYYNAKRFFFLLLRTSAQPVWRSSGCLVVKAFSLQLNLLESSKFTLQMLKIPSATIRTLKAL